MILIYFFSTSSSQPKPILQQSTSVSPSKSAKKKKKGKDSATSSEEERWLDAIESGKLEEVGLSIMVQVYFKYLSMCIPFQQAWNNSRGQGYFNNLLFTLLAS